MPALLRLSLLLWGEKTSINQEVQPVGLATEAIVIQSGPEMELRGPVDKKQVSTKHNALSVKSKVVWKRGSAGRGCGGVESLGIPEFGGEPQQVQKREEEECTVLCCMWLQACGRKTACSRHSNSDHTDSWNCEWRHGHEGGSLSFYFIVPKVLSHTS